MRHLIHSQQHHQHLSSLHGQPPPPQHGNNKHAAAVSAGVALHPAFSASRLPPEIGGLPGPIPVSVHGTLTAASLAMWPGHHHPGFAGLAAAGFAAGAAARLAVPTPLLAAGGAPPHAAHPSHRQHSLPPHPKPHNISHILGTPTKPASTAPLDLSGPETNGHHVPRPKSPEEPEPKKLRPTEEPR